MSHTISLMGVVTTELRQIVDERGAVLHMLRSDAPGFTQFGECYFSELVSGAVKAWKLHRRQTQNLAVPVGRIRLVLFDVRESSPTFGQLRVVEMGRPDAYFRVRIPPGIWYGFACLGKTPALLVNCSDHPHDPTESDIRPPADPEIPFDWSLPLGREL